MAKVWNGSGWRPENYGLTLLSVAGCGPIAVPDDPNDPVSP